MLIKAKTGNSKPKVFLAHTETEPTCVIKSMTKSEWFKAMIDEFNALHANHT